MKVCLTKPLEKMKVLCFGVLALCALVAGGELPTYEIPSDGVIKNHVGPYSQQFVFLDGNPENEPTLDITMETPVGRALIASVIEQALNDFRDVVINGSENMPVLDPMVMNKIGPYEFSVTGLRAKATINNFRAEGLQWYVVNDVSFNTLRLALGVDLTLPWLIVTGTYDAEVRLAILLTHRAGGNFRVFINRFDLGVDARLGTNLFGGHLVLRELNIKMDIHDTFIEIHGLTGSSLINSFINSFIQNLTQDVIQEQLGNVSAALSEALFDTINEVLKDFTLADILG